MKNIIKFLFTIILSCIIVVQNFGTIYAVDYNTEIIDKSHNSSNIISSSSILARGVGDTIESTFPDDNFAQLIADQLTGGDVSAIITQSMIDNTTLLYFSSKNISDVTGIGIFVNLESLYLESNNLTSLPSELGNLVKLKTLWLQSNHLTSLPDELGNLINVNIIDISRNNLKSLPSTIGNMSSLKLLQVNDNNLTSLPSTIGNISSLEILQVNNNNLTSLPDSIGNLSNLTTFYTNNNAITRLPESIGNLSSLKTLNLAYNKLSTLPDTIGNLLNLEILDAESNQLTSVVNTIGDLPSLLVLAVDSNQLTDLPSSIGNLSTLQILILGSNQLTNLPSSIGNLSNLRMLFINLNKFTIIPSDVKSLNSLEEFNAASNNLIDLPQSMYDFLIKINQCDISNQSYTQSFATQGRVNLDYSFVSLATQEQMTNYRVEWIYKLRNNTTGEEKIITPIINDGKITINGSDLDKGGDYILISSGNTPSPTPTGMMTLKSIEYQQTFTVKSNDMPILTVPAATKIKVGESFDELAGVTADDSEDGDLTSSIKVLSNSVDISKAGEYLVEYEVTDSDGNKVKATQKVTVSNDESEPTGTPPTLDVPAFTEIKVGYSFDVMDSVSASDIEDGDLTKLINHNGIVYINNSGVYVINYNITDSDGNTIEKKQVVLVNDGTYVKEGLRYIITAKDFRIHISKADISDVELLELAKAQVYDIEMTRWLDNPNFTIDRSEYKTEIGNYNVTLSFNPKIMIKVTVHGDNLPPTGIDSTLIVVIGILIVAILFLIIIKILAGKNKNK